MSSRRTILSLAGLICLHGIMWAQVPSNGTTPSSAQAKPAALDLILERFDHSQWIALDPQTVLDSGDSVRFKLRTSFPGYLYGYYRSSSGDAEWLYPPGSGTELKMDVGTTYVIPSGNRFYTISGKAGFDVVYWLISPRSLSNADRVPPREDEHVPRTMVPRCRDEASPKDVAQKTTCIDGRAGAGPSSDWSGSSAGGLKARELKLSAGDKTTHIEAAEGPGLFTYEFRIAHR